MLHEIDSLRVFIALCQSSSIRQGADKLNLTQPAISRRVQKLEEELNVQLFNRTSHGIELTECGEVLYQYATQIDNLCTKAVTEIDEIASGRVGEIRIGAGPAWCRSILPKAISALQLQYPRLKVTLVSGVNGVTMQMLEEDKLDIVIGALQPELDESNIYIYDFIRENETKVFAGVSHPLAAKSRLSMAELLDYPWLSFTGSAVGRAAINDMFDEHKLAHPNYSFETSSLQAAFAIIKENHFLMTLPDFLEDSLKEENMVSLPLCECIWKFPSGLVYRNNGRKHQVITRLKDLISQQISL